MKPRERIETEVKLITEAGAAPSVKDLDMQKLMVELLLDIRELLTPKPTLEL